MEKLDFEKIIVEKVKKEYISLIPEKYIDNLINKTIDDFRDNELPKIINDTLIEHVKNQIKGMLDSNVYGNWSYEKNMEELTPEIEKILINAAPKMFKEVMADVVRNTLINMQNNTY